VVGCSFVAAEGVSEDCESDMNQYGCEEKKGGKRTSQILAATARLRSARLLRNVIEVLSGEVGRVGEGAVERANEVSSMEGKREEERRETNRSWGMKGLSILRMVAQSTPAKKG
jgi:multidrug efflux pump subunit AcrA (membrane-fusion protein)